MASVAADYPEVVDVVWRLVGVPAGRTVAWNSAFPAGGVGGAVFCHICSGVDRVHRRRECRRPLALSALRESVLPAGTVA